MYNHFVGLRVPPNSAFEREKICRSVARQCVTTSTTFSGNSFGAVVVRRQGGDHRSMNSRRCETVQTNQTAWSVATGELQERVSDSLDHLPAEAARLRAPNPQCHHDRPQKREREERSLDSGRAGPLGGLSKSLWRASPENRHPRQHHGHGRIQSRARSLGSMMFVFRQLRRLRIGAGARSGRVETA
jgi:hypothetical protein